MALDSELAMSFVPKRVTCPICGSSVQLVLEPPFRPCSHTLEGNPLKWCTGAELSMAAEIGQKITLGYRRTRLVRDGFTQTLEQGETLSAAARDRIGEYLRKLDLEQDAREQALGFLRIPKAEIREDVPCKRWR